MNYQLSWKRVSEVWHVWYLGCCIACTAVILIVNQFSWFSCAVEKSHSWSCIIYTVSFPLFIFQLILMTCPILSAVCCVSPESVLLRAPALLNPLVSVWNTKLLLQPQRSWHVIYGVDSCRTMPFKITASWRSGAWWWLSPLIACWKQSDQIISPALKATGMITAEYNSL